MTAARALPAPIAAYIARSAAVRRRPAWLRVAAGRVLDAGGDLGTYGLATLVAAEDVALAAPFLDGLLPVSSEGLHLPWLAMEDGRFADVHVLPGEDGDWVLLLDATDEAERALPLQQSRNDESLGAERSLFFSLQSFFGPRAALALKRVCDDSYRVMGRVPRWAEGTSQEPVIRPERLFPFLRAFLPEAEAFFAKARAGTHSSDPWTQVLGSNGELQLEAHAVVLDPPCCALFIAPVGERSRRRERLLQSARERNLAHEQLNRDIERKDVLAHCIVHDLKGPLSCMQGYLQLALSRNMPDSQRHEFLDLALRQCRRQENLIGEVLDVFAAECGAPAVEASDSVVLADIARRVARDFQGSFEQAGRRLRFGADRDVEGVAVSGSASRMERVLVNLLENALRHTPRGACARVSLHHAGSELSAAVENEGLPVDESVRDRLFERFARGRDGGGSAGLGLFFCRITVERWGGSISYRPLTGGGSCFEVRLPLAD